LGTESTPNNILFPQCLEIAFLGTESTPNNIYFPQCMEILRARVEDRLGLPGADVSDMDDYNDDARSVASARSDGEGASLLWSGAVRVGLVPVWFVFGLDWWFGLVLVWFLCVRRIDCVEFGRRPARTALILCIHLIG
jgi:hypothetical protein